MFVSLFFLSSREERCYFFFFFQSEDCIRAPLVTGVQTCALPISADEVLGGVRFGRAPDGAPHFRLPSGLEGLAPLDCVDARLRLLGHRPFFVSARHKVECTLETCPPRSLYGVSPSVTGRSRRSAASISRSKTGSSSGCSGRTAPANRR